MATKKDLEKEVARLNRKYAKSGKNEFVIDGAYGGYMVGVTGKTNKNGKRKKWASSGLSTVGNDYHDTAKKTIDGLRKAESKGWLQRVIRRENAISRKRARLKKWYV